MSQQLNLRTKTAVSTIILETPEDVKGKAAPVLNKLNTTP
jgi:hypothetical protein